MPLGFGIGEIIGLVRETRGLEGSAGRIAIAGPGARELATELAAGGDPSAIAVDGDPLEALVAVRLIEGDPSEGDLAALRRISRAGTPVVVVRRGGGRTASRMSSPVTWSRQPAKRCPSTLSRQRSPASRRRVRLHSRRACRFFDPL